MSTIEEQQLSEDIAPTNTPIAPTPSGEDEAEGAEPMEVDISEEELADPKNLEGIEKSLYFKELELRAKHATELADMFGDHQAEVAAKKAADKAPQTARIQWPAWCLCEAPTRAGPPLYHVARPPAAPPWAPLGRLSQGRWL